MWNVNFSHIWEAADAKWLSEMSSTCDSFCGAFHTAETVNRSSFGIYSNEHFMPIVVVVIQNSFTIFHKHSRLWFSDCWWFSIVLRSRQLNLLQTIVSGRSTKINFCVINLVSILLRSFLMASSKVSLTFDSFSHLSTQWGILYT